MLVIIGQKQIEWDGRHNCNQPSLAKFIYGTTAWKLVLAGCMSVVDFRARDTDHITNKWDGLIKDYKKLKDYIEDMGSANWWRMSRDEKKELSRTSKMSLEFNEAMYNEMEGFLGKNKFLDVPWMLWTPTCCHHRRPIIPTVPHPPHANRQSHDWGVLWLAR